jgi:2-methylcitrate dehydratase PrpD
VVRTHRFASDLNEQAPKSLSARKSSIPYCTALAILKKRVFLDEFDLDPGEDAVVCNLARRVDVCLDPDLDAIHAADEGKRPSRVEIYLTTGETLIHETDIARGWWENPLSRGEFDEKFGLLVSRTLTPKKTDQIRNLVMDLDNLPSIQPLVSALASI